MLLTAEKRSWKESRGDEWSKTLYSGLYLVIKERPVLVSKLSHGLRVIPIVDPGKYRFVEGEGCGQVPVSNSFMLEVMFALEADFKFQDQVEEFERLMSA